MKYLILLILLSATYFSSLAQTQCGMPDMNAQQRRYLIDVIKKTAVDRNDGTTCVPIRPHIVRMSDGSGGVSLQTVNEGLTVLNSYYKSANIEFYLCGETPDYVDNSTYFNFNSADEAAMAAAAVEVSNALNMYFVETIDGGVFAGYAYFPFNQIQSTRIVMDNQTVGNTGGGTLVHELGHTFSLPHTHSGTENGNAHPNAESVARAGANANCSTNGDALCDTEADPRYDNTNFANCMDNSGRMDIHNALYDPPVQNVMSYYPDACGVPQQQITAGQYTLIGQGLVTRQGHGAYTLDCPPSNVADPSGLLASDSGAGIQLNWTDNANNEMGYLIERSTTSAATGFESIQGAATGPDGNSFLDVSVAANTTYYYRVKASNDNCNDYSNVVTVMSTYCAASSGVCDEYVSRVQLNTIDNNNMACAANGYTNFTNLSTNLTKGVDYTATITNGIAYAGDQCGVWADWNQDNDFDDAGETITVTGGTLTFSATINPPLTASVGMTRMRVRITYTGAFSACGSPTYGEVEDYMINVQSALPVELTTFIGTKKEKSVELNWETASELGNDYFEVERSADGRSFSSIMKMPGHGTTLEKQLYQTIDNAPFAGQNYYRLKQIDIDGSYTYSNVISIKFESTDKWTLRPVPTNGMLFLQTYNEIGLGVELEILNVAGQVVDTKSILWENKNEIRLDCQNLKSGIYWLRIINEREISNLKFIKQ